MDWWKVCMLLSKFVEKTFMNGPRSTMFSPSKVSCYIWCYTSTIPLSPLSIYHHQMLLEVIVHTPAQGFVGGGGQDGSPSQGGGRAPQRRPLLHFSPSGFKDALVKLVSELLVTTRNASNPRLEWVPYHIQHSTLITTKLFHLSCHTSIKTLFFFYKIAYLWYIPP